jgi:2-dehydro-3-deoxyphosphooctonate aldolase (KDO 8-P synthase)
VADILQIPLSFAGRPTCCWRPGAPGRIVNIKKGQFVAPHDIHRAAEKVASTGNRQVVLTERGSSFGYNNLVVDMRGLKIMRDAGWPVVFDATHSVQLPGAGRQRAIHLRRAAGSSSSRWRGRRWRWA